MICEIYGICIGRFNILWLILGIIVGTRMGEDTCRERERCQRTAWQLLVPVGDQPVPKRPQAPGNSPGVLDDHIGSGFGVPVVKPVPMLILTGTYGPFSSSDCNTSVEVHHVKHYPCCTASVLISEKSVSIVYRKSDTK